MSEISEEASSSEHWSQEIIWENWRHEAGQGPCEGCPAHWSQRQDIKGEPGVRTESDGVRPWYGDGDLTDVDVVILGHEPGTPKADRDREDATTKSFADVRGTEFEAVPDGAESLETASALFQTVTKHFSAYWTQAKKCNEISGSVPEADRQNTEAFDRCVGTDGYQGYLRDELRAVIPLYVLTLGKKAHEALHSVFQIESLGEKNFTHAIATGDNVAGLRTLAVENEQFVQVPLGHPSFGIGAKTKAVLGLEEKNGVSPTKQYYQLAGEGLVKLHQQRSEA